MKQPLKIALIAPLEESVPPKKYGGTEMIVSLLSNGLAQKGHNVFLFASGDSKTKAHLKAVFPKALRAIPQAQDKQKRETLKYIAIVKIIEALQKEKFDLIHNHIGWRLLPFASLLPAKMITTLHSPLDIAWQNIVYQKFSALPFVSVSNSQRKPLKRLNYIGTVYNGIDLDKFSFNPKPKGKYLAFLSRMSPEKGPREAILIAKKAKIELRMAAKVDVADKEYFTKKIKPLIDQKQIKFLGEIGPKEKNILLKNAVSLLAPLQWEEPFGLFIVEANACGTPVIAFNRGSAPELIKNGLNGFLTRDVAQAVEALKKINQIKRVDCRQWVEQNFSAEKMVENYEKLYDKLRGLTPQQSERGQTPHL